jgi:anti-sigma regulatory factor (Ser/Thr protein kinase)
MVTIKLKRELGEIQRVTAALEDFARDQGLDERNVFQLSLCLDELLTNTINYGYIDRVNPDDSCDISVSFGRLDNRLLVILEDDGQPFDPLQEADAPDLEADLESRSIGGLGLHLVRTFMDACRYMRVDDRNRLELEKQITPTHP